MLLTSAELLPELDRVLRYGKLHRYYTEGQHTRFVALIRALATVVALPESIIKIGSRLTLGVSLFDDGTLGAIRTLGLLLRRETL